MTRTDALALMREVYPNATRAQDAKRLRTTTATLAAVVYGHRKPSEALAARISADTAGVLSIEVLRQWDFHVPQHARAFERHPLTSRYEMAVADAATGTDA